ncbi:cytochrome P450 94A1-like [Capsicum annuum]|uniref:cytochrome P450 94A1-like n=1 Tax=Capsicum annuum TaxID=4072 RepID=UPI001FB0A523|nr:cytochrome P450 94A1-like [Capsicum annuum]
MVVCIKDPSNVKHILKTRFNNYHKERTVIEAFSDLFGKALFLSDGAEWKSQRQILQHYFDPKEFHAYTSIVEEELSSRLVPFLSNAEKTASTIDLQDILRRFTFDSVCQIGFGFDLKYLLPSLPPTPFADTYKTATKLSILRKRKERLLAREDLEDKDVLARILRRAKGEQLDDTFLIHTAVNFIMGGHDAMCPALTWFFWLVLSNQNVEKEIIREIREKDGHLSDMVYMHASIYESLRLFPPFPADSKEAVDDNVWPDGTKV